MYTVVTLACLLPCACRGELARMAAAEEDAEQQAQQQAAAQAAAAAAAALAENQASAGRAAAACKLLRVCFRPYNTPWGSAWPQQP